MIYNSGRFRMAGHGSLAGMMPYGDANAIVVEMAREVLPVVRGTPVLAGVCGTDPMRLMDRFLIQLRDLGFAGVQNFPTVGSDRRRLPREPGRNTDGLRSRSGNDSPAPDLDLLTTPYVFNPDEAMRDGRRVPTFWWRIMRLLTTPAPWRKPPNRSDVCG